MEGGSVHRMCRCCAAEGSFKDIKTTYHWMGDEEVYGDMLSECFDVKLITSDHGGICEMCITHLRNAANFKKQVLETEEQFRKHLESGKFNRPPVVKQEFTMDDEMGESDDNMDNGEDDDYVPDFEVPIKTEDELDEPVKPRKRACKATTSRAKKSKAEEKSQAQPTAQRRVIKTQRPILGLDRQRYNARLIMHITNATPISKQTPEGFHCCFCLESFSTPAELKHHTLGQHQGRPLLSFMTRVPLRSFIIKMDITDLQCKLCGIEIEEFEDVYQHITDVHNKKMFLDVNQYVLPFKFDTDEMKCIVCHDNRFLTLKQLQKHMYSHAQLFGLDNVLSCMPYKCNLCCEKFKHFLGRMKHLQDVHGVQFPSYDCNACHRKFMKPHLLKQHLHADHMMEKRYKCTLCPKEYYYMNGLREHLLSHSKIKRIPCDFCDKMFFNNKCLRQHIRIHYNDRKFKCTFCGDGFVQKCSLKRHLETKH